MCPCARFASFLRVSKAGTGATVFARHSARGRLGGSHLPATAGAVGTGARKASAAPLWGTEPERSCCTCCDPVDLLLCASVEAATLFPGRFSLTLPPTEQRAPGRGVGGHGPAPPAAPPTLLSAFTGSPRGVEAGGPRVAWDSHLQTQPVMTAAWRASCSGIVRGSGLLSCTSPAALLPA